MNIFLEKLRRLQRAFACGFWHAWLELPPAYAREITVVVDDQKMWDTFEAKMQAEIRRDRQRVEAESRTSRTWLPTRFQS